MSWEEHAGWVVGAHVHDEHGIVTASVHGDVKFWDARSPSALRTIRVSAHAHACIVCVFVVPARIHGLALTPWLVCRVRVWGFAHVRPRWLPQTSGSTEANMTSFAAHPMSSVFAVGATTQSIKVYTMDGRPLNKIRYHEGFMGQRIGKWLRTLARLWVGAMAPWGLVFALAGHCSALVPVCTVASCRPRELPQLSPAPPYFCGRCDGFHHFAVLGVQGKLNVLVRSPWALAVTSTERRLAWSLGVSCAL